MTGRKLAVLAWLREHGPATDRQVKDGLLGPYADMNGVRPRISDLVTERLVVECGKATDELTGKSVRVVRARRDGETGAVAE